MKSRQRRTFSAEAIKEQKTIQEIASHPHRQVVLFSS
jgi:hypothetical protein